MLTDEILQGGGLEGSLQRLQEQVRKAPDNVKHRIFLFQLLSVMSQWDRALNQLNVLAQLDAATLPMVQTYRQAIRTEGLRRAVFAGERSPLIFGDPAQWLALQLRSLQLAAQGQLTDAMALRRESFALAPASPGRIEAPQEHAFAWIADADERLGPVLEAIIDGKYYWVPVAHVQRLSIEAPTDLRDLVWLPATFTWQNGGESVALIPVRYPDLPNSQQTPVDDNVRMATLTEWIDLGDGYYVGHGQRVLATDVDEYALMDLRQISFSATPSSDRQDDEATDPA